MPACWITPSEVVAEGFAASRVVMMNEAHNGWTRCVRTREIGRSVLPAAHDAGCRYLAMEALTNSGPGPTFFESRPQPIGYLGQPEMAALVDTALGLGWTLIAYEVAWDQTPDRHRAQPLTMEATNHRELAQAQNLIDALGHIGATERLLVWCGNAHHSKESAGEWVPMGARFTELSDTDPFCIDQTATVSLSEGHLPHIEVTSELARTLHDLGGTAGFTRHRRPEGLEVPSWCDALILSTDNRVVADPPRSI